MLIDFSKDSDWTEIEKQFKSDVSNRCVTHSYHFLLADTGVCSSIDWAFFEEHYPHPEVAARYKLALETIKFEPITVDQHWAEVENHLESISVKIREQNAKYQEMLPGLEKDLQRSLYWAENVDTITIDEERAHEPAIFAAIEKEHEVYNWDDEEVEMPDPNKAHAHH